MTAFLDLFSGIGGFALGAYWAGLRFDKHYFSEIDDYAVQVYQRHFPNAEPLGDIKNVDYAKLPRGEYLVTGGFPCQPHSTAGKRKGAGDERDLWPECARVLRELRPAVALFENVPGLFVSNRGEFFNRVLSDITESGYDAEWQIISAQDVGAPHLRKRIFIVGFPQGMGLDSDKTKTRTFSKTQDKTESPEMRLWNGGAICVDNRLYPQFEYARVGNGPPEELDAVRGIGNAVVPQCAEIILSLPAFALWRAA